jgi:hypothetical protein
MRPAERGKKGVREQFVGILAVCSPTPTSQIRLSNSSLYVDRIGSAKIPELSPKNFRKIIGVATGNRPLCCQTRHETAHACSRHVRNGLGKLVPALKFASFRYGQHLCLPVCDQSRSAIGQTEATERSLRFRNESACSGRLQGRWRSLSPAEAKPLAGESGSAGKWGQRTNRQCSNQLLPDPGFSQASLVTSR